MCGSRHTAEGLQHMICHLSLDRESVASHIFSLISKYFENMGIEALPTEKRQSAINN